MKSLFYILAAVFVFSPIKSYGNSRLISCDTCYPGEFNFSYTEGALSYGRIYAHNVTYKTIQQAGYTYRIFKVKLKVAYAESPVVKLLAGHQAVDGNTHNIKLFILGEIGSAQSGSEAEIEIEFYSDSNMSTQISVIEGSQLSPTTRVIGNY